MADATTAEPGYFDTIFTNVGDILSNGIITGTAQAVDEVLNPSPLSSGAQSTAKPAAQVAASASNSLVIGLIIAVGLFLVLRAR
jgi:hypothetical protein